MFHLQVFIIREVRKVRRITDIKRVGAIYIHIFEALEQFPRNNEYGDSFETRGLVLTRPEKHSNIYFRSRSYNFTNSQ